MFGTSALLVIASFAMGQLDAPPSNYQHLEELEYFVGNWEAEGTGPDGSDYTVLRSVQWVLNKNFLADELVIKVGDRQVWASRAMIGWDPSEKKIKQWTANSMGGLGEILWAQEGNGGTGESSGLAADGRSVSATHIVTGTGEDDLTYEVKDLKVGDDTMPAFTFEFTRTEPVKSPLIVESEDASSENYDRLKHDNYFVGEWTGTGTVMGQEFIVETATKWDLNKNFLFTTFAAKMGDQVVFENRSLRGWDPSAAQVKEWSFNSWGGVGEAVVTRQGDKKRTIESQGLASDGRKATSKSIITISDENSYSALVTDQKIDGETMDDIQAEYKRKKPGKD